MSGRITDAILGAKAFGKFSNQPMLDPTYGGQQAWAPNLNQWVSNQAYVRKNLIPVLLRAPKLFTLLDGSEYYYRTLRAMIETHSVTIDGLKAGLTVETDEHPVGGGGEMQEEVTNVKRERSTPTHEFVEKYGMPFKTFLSFWIRCIQHEETKYSILATLGDNKAPDDFLADWYTATVAYIEPDPTGTKCLKCWVCANMFPKGTGDIIGKSDKTAASELDRFSVEFANISQYNLGTQYLGQTILDSFKLVNANPWQRAAFIDGIDQNVKSAVMTGFEESINQVSRDIITPV